MEVDSPEVIGGSSSEVAVTMQQSVVPEEREGSKTPEMPVEAPSQPPPPKVHPELAEFDVPERILRLIESLPDVQEYILDLHRTFRSFKTATAALQQLQSGGSSSETRTVFMPKKKKKVEPVSGGESWLDGMSIADQVKEVAESVVEETGFVYHESLGLYYDNQTGYYYDPKTGLYYDGVNKTYYTYDEPTGVFSVYHQQEEKDPEEVRREHWEQELERKKRELLLEVKKMKTKKKREEKLVEEEEGECSTDTEDESFNYYKRKKPVKESRVQPIAHKIPTADEIDPCMRLIVQQTDLEKLRVGSLFIVTCTGGSLGREGKQHSVTIPDLNVSKSHCKFTYEDCGYWLTDSGSTNGTWLNKKQLKKDKCRQIMHGSILRVANTQLLCHIHPGQETCGHCEPGLLLQQPEVANEVAPEKSLTHKDELLRIRRRFALSGIPEPDGSLATGYTDRADKRRVTVGSQHHGEKTEVASVDAAMPQSNKGFKMLEKMGWKSGETLGKDGVSGISEPVAVDFKNDKSGLGLDSIPLPAMPNAKGQRKQEAWSKARSRYLNIPEPPPEN